MNNQWISVDEATPSNHSAWVWVFDGVDVSLGRLGANHKWDYILSNGKFVNPWPAVTHWMPCPLPQPPEVQS